MNYYNSMELLFSLIVPSGMIAYFLNAVFINRIFDNYTENDEIKVDNIPLSIEKWKLIMKKTLKVITLICLVILVVLGLYFRIYILGIIFFSFQMIEQFNNFFFNLTKVKKTFNQEISDKLSIKERGWIVGLFGLFFFINLYKIPNNVILKIESLDTNILSDFLLITFLMILSMIYFFSICFSLFEIMHFIVFIVKIILKKIKRIFLIKISKFLSGEIKKDFSWEFMSISFLEKMRKQPLVVMIVIIPAIIIDIIFKLLYYSYRTLISFSYNLLIFLRYLSSFFTDVFEKIQKISDRKIVVIFLRGSFILSILSLVIYNRYNPLMKQYSEGTAIFEFLSSTILIPLLLSWILELKNN